MTTDPRDSSRPSAPSPSSVPASDTGPVTLSVNGASREIPYGSTLDQLVTGLTSAPSGVAAAVNETVVPRGEWARLRLAEGDRVEVLTAVQGG
ncbi:sulfur carrier protein [Streptomyces sp. Amel2xB2]|uniref:sulfur carrier protein ThiS n=1 Tax=Streptomyces sp. Amel2xB2 TaxID=1305829 RepID=UPI000DB98A69|nr:sulfur carrier protein ThiS [Streptomyces sp. Amel2xB2]RAJ65467.1 sulfur carrier protein [Streptomyces sp. Amel2xB2]